MPRFVYNANPTRHAADDADRDFWRFPKRMVSAEIEYLADRWEKVPAELQRIGGAVVSDGSVSDGAEINTPPCEASRFPELMVGLAAALEADGARVDQRCGLHVHIDASDYTLHDLRRLVRLWIKYEEMIFRLVPPSRRTSRWCAPLRNDPGLRTLAGLTNPEIPVNSAFRNWTGVNWSDDLSLRKGAVPRYLALNVASFTIRRQSADEYSRTIEVRLHGGTVEADKIANWAIFMAALIERGADSTIAEIDAMPDGLPGLLALAPTPGNRLWLMRRWKKFNRDNQ